MKTEWRAMIEELITATDLSLFQKFSVVISAMFDTHRFIDPKSPEVGLAVTIVIAGVEHPEWLLGLYKDMEKDGKGHRGFESLRDLARSMVEIANVEGVDEREPAESVEPVDV